MNKNKEWLKEQIGFQEIELGHFTSNYSSCEKMMLVDDIKDLIDQLDELEKAVIPKYVADLIGYLGTNEEKNKDYALSSVLEQFYEQDFEPETWHWFNTIGNKLKFFRAVEYGYTIEQEKRYRLKLIAPILTDNDEVFLNVSKAKVDYFIRDEEDTRYDKTIFTESELTQMDETGFKRDPVEEEEE